MYTHFLLCLLLLLCCIMCTIWLALHGCIASELGRSTYAVIRFSAWQICYCQIVRLAPFTCQLSSSLLPLVGYEYKLNIVRGFPECRELNENYLNDLTLVADTSLFGYKMERMKEVEEDEIWQYLELK